MLASKLRSEDSSVRQGYARRFIDKVVVAPGSITISGPVKPLELAMNDDTDQRAPMVPSLDRKWCPTEDKDGHSDHWKISVLRG